MVYQNTDPHGTAFTVSIDHKTTTTGISAIERATTILEILNLKLQKHQFQKTRSRLSFNRKRRGSTTKGRPYRSSCGLSIPLWSEPAGVICEIVKEDGTMARVPDLKKIAMNII